MLFLFLCCVATRHWINVVTGNWVVKVGQIFENRENTPVVKVLNKDLRNGGVVL